MARGGPPAARVRAASRTLTSREFSTCCAAEQIKMPLLARLATCTSIWQRVLGYGPHAGKREDEGGRESSSRLTEDDGGAGSGCAELLGGGE